MGSLLLLVLIDNNMTDISSPERPFGDGCTLCGVVDGLVILLFVFNQVQIEFVSGAKTGNWKLALSSVSTLLCREM